MGEQIIGLNDKVCLVTGGTGVLGSVMSRGLSKAGAHVVVVGRRIDVAQKLAKELSQSGPESLGIAADVLELDQLEDAAGEVIARFGRIDVLINAAGGNIQGAVVQPNGNFFDMDVSHFRDVVDLNLLGTVLPTRVFAAKMAKVKRGVIVNISSLAALKPLTRVVGYSAAKAAVTNFTQWLAVEVAGKYGEGFRVNAIAPGFFLTEQNKSLLTNADGSLTDRGKQIVTHTPFGRFGRPEELVGTLLWLCSDASQFVTGIVVPVDGGFSAFAGV